MHLSKKGMDCFGSGWFFLQTNCDFLTSPFYYIFLMSSESWGGFLFVQFGQFIQSFNSVNESIGSLRSNRKYILPQIIFGKVLRV